jgi:hypothetical protein
MLPVQTLQISLQWPVQTLLVHQREVAMGSWAW